MKLMVVILPKILIHYMAEVLKKMQCYHCGDECTADTIIFSEKYFCCVGCKLVYEILKENNLCTYYDWNTNPGVKQQNFTGKRFDFLDDVLVKQKLIDFQHKNEIRVTFKIPGMHCSSCIWLLENFHKLDKGVISSEVNFLKKELSLYFDDRITSLRKIAEQLTQTGYEPELHLDSIGLKENKKVNKSRIIKIGVAGFCFGNIMMLSFPEYFSSGKISDQGLKYFFSYINLLLALPVFFYSASEFFVKSYKAIKLKTSAIDIPIALGIAAIFLRSVYEIISHTGSGYFDSGSGLVFFVLIGRWFQDFTFDSLQFDRDYKSYFPIAVTTIRNGQEMEVSINDLNISDHILIRNNEIIPVDALLLSGRAAIDYHFVTGESIPVNLLPGQTIFAGGRQSGSMLELLVTKKLSQSYLTQLWNRNFDKKENSSFDKIVQHISKWFIAGTLTIAFAAAAYWWKLDIHKAINAFTAVLVIACPCALALSAPFTYGNILRILGRNKIYLRDYQALEKLADINVVVFDKTGTLTENSTSHILFVGEPLKDEEKKAIFSLVRQSSHPLSKLLSKEISSESFYPVNDYRDFAGKGISAVVNEVIIKVGSLPFISKDLKEVNEKRTTVYVSIDGEYRGYFVLSNSYRTGIKDLVSELRQKKFGLAVLTGDNESEKENLNNIFSGKAELRFNQTPEDKLNYINSLHEKKLKVLMIGDGLNDAGALLQSDVGISLTENTNSFTPASDGIADASSVSKLSNLLVYAKSAVRIIIISFILSLLYNFIGLSFAVTGELSPLIAAILMPISTISLVMFTLIASTVKGRILKFK